MSEKKKWWTLPFNQAPKTPAGKTKILTAEGWKRMMMGKKATAKKTK